MIQLHIFTIFMFKRDICLFPSMSIQILVYFYAPDRPSARMKCDYAIANVRDFWRWTLNRELTLMIEENKGKERSEKDIILDIENAFNDKDKEIIRR